MFKREVHKFPYNAVNDNPAVASMPKTSSIHTVVSILHRHYDRETPVIAYTSLCRVSKRRIIMQWMAWCPSRLPTTSTPVLCRNGRMHHRANQWCRVMA